MPPKRILHLFVTLPVGGAENLLVSIVKRLDPDRFTSVVCTLGEKGLLAPQIEALGVPVVELKVMQRGRGYVTTLRRLAELVRREHIDLIHAHLYHANLFGRLVARWAGIPCVISIHNTYDRPKLHRRLANWWLSRKTAAIITGSSEIKRDVVRYDRPHERLVEVVPNSIDLARAVSDLTRQEARARLGLSDTARVLGTIGRLEKQKGHRFLLSAMKELREHGVETELLLVGSGRAEVALRAQADQLGLAGSVHFLGTRNDLGDLFRAIDLFVMPSLWEGLSLAMLTAMAAGLPVVTTDVGGVLESIGHDERGFVVAPGDASALAAKLAWCLAHPDETQAKASAGAAFVRAHYSDEAMVRRIESVYERVFSLGH